MVHFITPVPWSMIPAEIRPAAAKNRTIAMYVVRIDSIPPDYRHCVETARTVPKNGGCESRDVYFGLDPGPPGAESNDRGCRR
jgi:hypothetical protein